MAATTRQTIVSQQVSTTQPLASSVQTGTDLLLPPQQVAERLRHMPESVYNLNPESHIVRLMKVILGDAGAGQLRKRLLQSRLQQTIQGTHFFDLDRFYGALFGARRLDSEKFEINPYGGVATVDQWTDINLADASFRSRVMQLSRAISFGPTPTGLELAAEALFSVDCDIYESYIQSDAGFMTYGEIEAAYDTYADMEGVSYGTLEGEGSVVLAGDERREFVVRPKRTITPEESFDATRVFNRLKPADSRFIIDSEGIAIHSPATIRGLTADSNQWEVVAKRNFAEPPRPPFTGYQGEAWSYLNDLAAVSAYSWHLLTEAVDEVADTVTQEVAQELPAFAEVVDGVMNPLLVSDPAVLPVQRVQFDDGASLDFTPNLAVVSPLEIDSGRAISDAILTAHPYSSPRLFIDSLGQDSDRQTLSQVFSDLRPLDIVLNSLAGLRNVAGPLRQHPEDRFWCSPDRTQNNLMREVVQIRLGSDKKINYISFEASHFPHVSSVQVFDVNAGRWVEVFRNTVRDSFPKFITPTTTQRQHELHGRAGHWIRINHRFEAVKGKLIRIVMRRTTGDGPRRVPTTPFPAGRPIAYSLAVRNWEVGYRVTKKSDLPLDEDWPTRMEADGSIVQYSRHDEKASDLLTTAKRWRSEPQPMPEAVVNFYVDARDEDGNAQIIDRFYLEPTTPGVNVDLYYSSDDVDPEALNSEATDAEIDAFWSQVYWTPVARDFVLQRGYFQFPTTKAKFWKFEFTDLTAEPYDVLLPVIRDVKVKSWGRATKDRDPAAGASPNLAGGYITAINAGAERKFSDQLGANPLIYRDQVVVEQYTPTEAVYTTNPEVTNFFRKSSYLRGFQDHHRSHKLGSASQKHAAAGLHYYARIEVLHTTKVAYFVGLSRIEASRVNYAVDDDTKVFKDTFIDTSNVELEPAPIPDPEPPPPPPPDADARVWGVSQYAAGDVWWGGDGTTDSDAIFPLPDDDSFDQGDSEAGAAWYAGGSDGTNIYQLAVDSTGQWWVDKFSASITLVIDTYTTDVTLLDRWEVSGWTSASGGDQWEVFFDVQHVCADDAHVVVVTDKIDSSTAYIGIETSVFDLSGSLLHQWSYALTDLDEFGSRYSIHTRTGSCTDGAFVYFWMDDPVLSPHMVKVELATGDLTQLFALDDLNAQSPDPDNIYINPGGVIVKDGDILVAGNDCVARVQQDGTLVWITQAPDFGGGMSLQSLAHSGNDSVWAGKYPDDTQAEEYTYDGAYVQTIDIPAATLQSWLVGG